MRIPTNQHIEESGAGVDTNKVSLSKKKISRRRFLLSLVGGAVALPVTIGSYARWMEPEWLQDRKLTCYIDRLPRVFDGMRIAHISDIHYGKYANWEDVERIVERVERSKPDMICLTGDLVDERWGETNQLVEVLSRFRAPLGQYAVLGNHDYSRGADLASHLLTQAGFVVLNNQNRVITAGQSHFAIAGIDDALEGDADLDQALAGIPPGTCCVLLAHEPDIADWTLQHGVDLQLSGHSHGGQVRLPFIGSSFLPRMGRKYYDGQYILTREQGRGRLDTPLIVYTSRGTGTSLLPVRLFCPPEWTLITLRVVAG